MNDVYFSADWHYNHKRIIELGNRPFSSVEEMNETLINNWNSTVKRGDRIYFLGDLGFFRTTEETTKLVKSLNGQKFFIYGNHDRRKIRRSEGWIWKGNYRRITISNQHIVLSHYPMVTWHGAHRGAVMLHGHSHHNLIFQPVPRLDVGVDGYDFYPISFEQVMEIMKDREYVSVDHHKS